MKIIDLRSDTVTRPTKAMRSAMMNAEVGDDVYGEDPTVNRLEALASEMLGSEAALFVCSGTQGNLLALLTHCQRGDEYIAGMDAHCYRCEGGGAAALGGIQPQPIPLEPNGTLDLGAVEDVVKPLDDHYPRTRLLCLENTQAGKILPLPYLEAATCFAKGKGLRLHLDGARIFNAAKGVGTPVAEISRHFDSVSACLSKGLGAPAGAVLCGTKDFVREARRWRKVTGGGMRQAGILAAAGIYALTNHIERLQEDHENALLLVRELAVIDDLRLDPGEVQTNMVFLTPPPQDHALLLSHLKTRGVLAGGYGKIRMVTHLDVTKNDVLAAASAVKDFYLRRKG